MPALAPTTTPGGAWLRGLRERRGLTQTEFADELGVKQGTISRTESGARGITPGLAYRLIVRVGVTPTEVAPYVPSGNGDSPGYLDRGRSGIALHHALIASGSGCLAAA